jgi:hypothetical protein
MGISLVVLVGAAAASVAQPPISVPPVPAPPAAQPAARTLPTPLPWPTSHGTRPPAPTPVPNRVVLFQKPADEAPGQQPKNDKVVEPPDPDEGPPTPVTNLPFGGRSPLDVMRLEGDDELMRRLTQELIEDTRKRKTKLDPEWKPAPEFYKVPPVTQIESDKPYVEKAVREAYPPMRSVIEPDYVVHRRLYFEEKNSERYGWDIGIAQPFVSALYFYRDTLLWPARLASNPFERYSASAGKCLPGSPVPYFLYPPEIDLFGATVGAGTIIGVAAMFP